MGCHRGCGSWSVVVRWRSCCITGPLCAWGVQGQRHMGHHVWDVFANLCPSVEDDGEYAGEVAAHRGDEMLFAHVKSGVFDLLDGLVDRLQVWQVAIGQ